MMQQKWNGVFICLSSTDVLAPFIWQFTLALSCPCIPSSHMFVNTNDTITPLSSIVRATRPSLTPLNTFWAHRITFHIFLNFQSLRYIYSEWLLLEHGRAYNILSRVESVLETVGVSGV